MRFYVAPHRIDVDLCLFNSSNPETPLISSGLGYAIQEVLFGNVTAGRFHLDIRFFAERTQQWDDCSFISVEFQIVPLDRAFERLSNFPCPSQETLVPLDLFSNIAQDDLTYEASDLVVISHPQVGSGPYNVRFVEKIPFTIPENSAFDLWVLRATSSSGISKSSSALISSPVAHLECS